MVVGNTFDGAWLTYNNVDFGAQGKNHVEIVYDAPSSRAPTNVVAEIRLGGADGEIIGTVNLPNTGSSWGTYKAAGVNLNKLLSGKQTISVVFKGSTTSSLMYVGNIDRMVFSN
ncbi:Carbohydrate binding module (family 6) [compost metagenome]